jgi:hypothetical protein
MAVLQVEKGLKSSHAAAAAPGTAEYAYGTEALKACDRVTVLVPQYMNGERRRQWFLDVR